MTQCLPASYIGESPEQTSLKIISIHVKHPLHPDQNLKGFLLFFRPGWNAAKLEALKRTFLKVDYSYSNISIFFSHSNIFSFFHGSLEKLIILDVTFFHILFTTRKFKKNITPYPPCKGHFLLGWRFSDT